MFTVYFHESLAIVYPPHFASLLLVTMSFFRIFIYLGSFLTFSTQAEQIESYTKFLPDGSNLAFVAQKVGSNTPIMSYRSQQLALPASTQKVITALAALLQLGPDYQFVTTLESNASLRDHILDGDLTARFTGDPTLTRQQVRNLVNKLKLQGITTIRGDLLIDTSIFSSHDKAPGWVWNDMTHCFSAPASAAVIDKNCFSVALYSSSTVGEKAFVRVASYYPVNMFSEVVTIAKGAKEGQFCELDVIPGELNRYTLTGCLPQRQDPLPLAFAIQNGASYAGAIIKNELAQAGITLTGHVRQQKLPGQSARILAENRSTRLYELLKVMLKKSDNLIADTIFRTVGYHYFQRPATWRSSSDAVRYVLSKKAGIQWGNSLFVDGSGLSRHNLISPTTMMSVLQYIAKHDNELQFISLLPLAGHDGTLRYRGGLHEAGVNGKVSAKTGALQGVYNLVGFMTASSGQQIAFVQFLSSYAVPPQQYQQRRVPLVKFESRVYSDLYRNN